MFWLKQLSRRHSTAVPLLIALTFAGSSQFASSQTSSLSGVSRIAGSVDESKLVTLTGNTHPLALPQFDLGRVPDSMPLQHMYLQLQRSPDQETALTNLLTNMQDPTSAQYHQWLTASQLGAYGPSQADINTVVSWLSSYGMQVNGVSKSGLTLDVSGTAGQVRQAFHTEIHAYNVNGKQHIANASDPQIPAALAPVVAGFNSLNDFLPKPALQKPHGSFTYYCQGCPDGFNDTTQYNEAPADLATIYNVTPLYKAGKPITGKGQTVAVIEVTDVNSADVATFRSAFGLDSYTGTFTQIHPGAGCTDPGTNGAEGEAALDSEWAGAVAPDAKVELASCANSSTNSGLFIAAQNLLDQKNPPPIMSLSYAGCEAAQGPSGNLYIAELWEQASLEGVSVFVSAGDGSAAGCDDFDTASYAISGIAANGLGSTPYNTATGGTDFLDTVEGANSQYWKASNNAKGESAKSYVPEMPWDDSCASEVLYEYFGYSSGLDFCNSTTGENFLNISGGSGAPSFVYAKPYWQKGVFGNPTDGARDLPDVSLFASNGFYSHAILFCMSDASEGGAPCDYTVPSDVFYNSAGGTSFTAPQFASIQALINQKAGGAQGNPAPIYYDLAKQQYGTNASPNKNGIASCNATLGNDISGSCLFQDITVGSNDVPCYGTNDCYAGKGLQYGVLSTSDKKLNVAYPAQSGWDFTTGLGSLNVENIVNSWP